MNDQLFSQKINYESKALGIELVFDPKGEVVSNCRFYFPSDLKEKITSDFATELSLFCVGKTLTEIRDLKKITFLKNHTDKLPLLIPEVVALDRCIDYYYGQEATVPEQKDILCTCFNLTERKLKELVLKDHLFDLKKLIAQTHATSACGSCLPLIQKKMEQIRNENGQLSGAKSRRARKNSKGEWIKVAGLYPIDLLITLDDLKQEWLLKNDLTSKINITFTKLEGLHVKTEIDVDDEFKKNLLIEALRDYVLDKLGVLIFFDV